MEYFPVDLQQSGILWFARYRPPVPQFVSHRNDGFSRVNVARRSGYTLVEMIISVGLLVVLMTVVWGLMSTYTTLQTAGAETAAEQQLVRSVMQLIRNDLEAVSLTADDVTAVPGPDSRSRQGGSVRSVFAIKDLLRHQDGGPANIAIRGTADVIRITIPWIPAADGYVNETDRFGDSAEVASSVDEFQTIVYQFQRYSPTDNGDLPSGLYRIQTDAARLQLLSSRQSRTANQPVRNELRVDRDIIEELLIAPSGVHRGQSVSLSTESGCELISDVTGCRFSYFDGHTWHQNWATVQDSLLPVAIRTTLEIVSMRELAVLRAVSVSEEAPDQLEEQLQTTFVRSGTPPGRSGSRKPFAESRVVPRSYSSLILLDTSIRTGPPSLSGDLYAVEGRP